MRIQDLHIYLLYRFLKNDNSDLEEMIINLNKNVNQLKGK